MELEQRKLFTIHTAARRYSCTHTQKTTKFIAVTASSLFKQLSCRKVCVMGFRLLWMAPHHPSHPCSTRYFVPCLQIDFPFTSQMPAKHTAHRASTAAPCSAQQPVLLLRGSCQDPLFGLWAQSMEDLNTALQMRSSCMAKAPLKWD